MKLFLRICISSLVLTIGLVFRAVSAFAVIIPGPADINRISPGQSGTSFPPSNDSSTAVPPPPTPGTSAPKGAKNIHFILHGLSFKNVTVFSSTQLQDLYAPYVDKKITLDLAWQIADALTAKYRQKGYFLSRAFVPAQEVSKGILKIQAVEGSIGAVRLSGDKVPDSSVINKAIETIETEKPIRLQTVEHQLLLLNDLPGLSFQAVLLPSRQANGTEVNMVMTVTKTKGVTTLAVNNNGSRYIGPYEASAEWSGSLLPLQQTDLSVTEAPPLSSQDGKFLSLSGTQKITLLPDVILDITAGYSNATPGYTLNPLNVVSHAENAGIGISYRAIRQRDKNLSVRLAVDFRNTDTDILQTPLSHDRIRAMQWGINYDITDAWQGHNYLDVELRHGLPVLGSSRANDPMASQPDVHPDFTKVQFNYTRLQTLTNNWSSLLVISGQKASGALYSSEDLGYGGTAIGRAYDPSEISGDEGFSGSVELHYHGLPQWYHTVFTPYAFYDIGKVWNLYPSQPSRISGASAGPGINIQNLYGLSGNFYIAQPLTKPVNVPLYSSNGKAPRYAFQVNYKF